MAFTEGMITEESAEKAAEILREVLEERFQDEALVFHQIIASRGLTTTTMSIWSSASFMREIGSCWIRGGQRV